MTEKFDTDWGVGIQRAYVEKHDTPNSPHREHMKGAKQQQEVGGKGDDQLLDDVVGFIDELGSDLEREDEDEFVEAYLDEVTRVGDDPRQAGAASEEGIRQAFQTAMDNIEGLQSLGDEGGQQGYERDQGRRRARGLDDPSAGPENEPGTVE